MVHAIGRACLLAGLGFASGTAAAAPRRPPAAAEGPQTDPSPEELRRKAQERMSLDRTLLSTDQFRALEDLYQSANRDLRAPGARAKLKAVVERFPQSNRAGCAVLYLAQMSEGDEREAYLRRAIARYGNTWYGDGVQVGALARAQLALHDANAGRRDEALRLAEELRAQFPGAVDHSGAKLIDGLQTLKPAPVK